MQQVASYTTAGGQTKHVMWDEGRFSVDGYEIALGDVLSWDENGLLTWASPETREWARSLAHLVAPAPALARDEPAATEGATHASGRDALIADIRAALFERTGYSVATGARADLEIGSEVASANWGTGAKKVSFEAVLTVQEADKTVRYWEALKESSSGLAFGSSSVEAYSTVGWKRSGAKKETVLGPEGVAVDYAWDYAKTRELVEQVCARHSYKLKVVLLKSKALR